MIRLQHVNHYEVEQLYIEFKKRIMKELMVDVPFTSHYGCLVDKGVTQEKEPKHEDK